MKVTVSGGVDLHVEVDGAGPGLVLVNGAFCTVRQWDGIVERLAESFTVIRHDVRGTGRSGAGPADDYTFERYSDDIVEVLDHLGVQDTRCWGMAWGARVALVTAARHPARVARLVLSDLAIDPADTDAQKAGARAATQARAAAGLAEVARPVGWNEHDDVDETMRALRATALHPDLWPMVERVAAPTLVLTGDHDPNLVSSRRAVGGFVDGRLEVLEHTGHGSVFHRPDLVAARAAAFLS